MTDTTQLGAEIGAQFARQRERGSTQKQEAQALIDAVIEQDPRVKLPHLLADQRIKEWAQEKGVTESHLKEALAKARANLQAKATTDSVRVPPKKRKRNQQSESSISTEPRQTAHMTAAMNRRVIPNQSLDLL